MSTLWDLGVGGIWELDVISSFSSVSLILIVANPKYDGTADVRWLHNKPLKTIGKSVHPVPKSHLHFLFKDDMRWRWGHEQQILNHRQSFFHADINHFKANCYAYKRLFVPMRFLI